MWLNCIMSIHHYANACQKNIKAKMIRIEHTRFLPNDITEEEDAFWDATTVI